MSWTVQVCLLCAWKHIVEQEGCFRHSLGTGGFGIWSGSIFWLVATFIFLVTRWETWTNESKWHILIKSSPNMLSTAIPNGRKNIRSKVLHMSKSCLHWPIWRIGLFHRSYVYCSTFPRLFTSAGVPAYLPSALVVCQPIFFVANTRVALQRFFSFYVPIAFSELVFSNFYSFSRLFQDLH